MLGYVLEMGARQGAFFSQVLQQENQPYIGIPGRRYV